LNRSQAGGRVRPLTLLVFALPNLVMGVGVTAMSVVLPAYYATHTSATLSGIATGLLAARVLEVITDPLIGHFTDITRSPLGARKPWLLAGGFLAPIAILFLFGPSPQSGSVYFGFWASFTYLAWTTINIPYRAWSVELSRDYDERSKIFTVTGIAQGLGALTFAALPLLPLFSTTGIVPATLRTIGWGLAAAYPIAIVFAILFVPRGPTMAGEGPSLRTLLPSVRSNRPLLRFLGAYMLAGIGQSIVISCFYFFIDDYLGLGAKFPLILLTLYACGMLGIPMWLGAMLKFGKPRTLALGYLSIAVLGCGFLFIRPGADSLVPALVAAGLYGIVNTIDVLVPFAVLGDVVDYDTWKTGSNRAGNYNAMAVFLQKANIALGGALAFYLLDLGGFRAGHHNGQGTTSVFFIVFVGLPALLYLASAATLWRFPLDRRRHDIVRRRLERRTARP